MSKRKKGSAKAEGDMTPMIDMVFQLLIFFMILINFSQAEQNQRVRLPESDLAKPPEQPLKDSFTLHIASKDPANRDNRHYEILFGADKADSPEDLASHLPRLIEESKRSGKTVKDITVVIRADLAAKTGYVQEVIQACQKQKLEKFVLRAQGRE